MWDKTCNDCQDKEKYKSGRILLVKGA